MNRFGEKSRGGQVDKQPGPGHIQKGKCHITERETKLQEPPVPSMAMFILLYVLQTSPTNNQKRPTPSKRLVIDHRFAQPRLPTLFQKGIHLVVIPLPRSPQGRSPCLLRQDTSCDTGPPELSRTEGDDVTGAGDGPVSATGNEHFALAPQTPWPVKTSDQKLWPKSRFAGGSQSLT